MAERISAYNVPGCLTFAHGRVPDNDTIPEPPRVARPDHRLRHTVLACLAVIALAILYGALQ